MSQIEKTIASFVADGKPVDGVTPDVRVEVVSGKVIDIISKNNSQNIIISVAGEEYKHNGYVGENELVFSLLKKAKELNKTVIVRLERKRKKGIDPKEKILDLTKDMDTARKNVIKLTVGVYDENKKEWLLTNEAESDPAKDPSQVKSGIDSVNYNSNDFFRAPSTPKVVSNKELNSKSDSLVTLYFFLRERANKLELPINDDLLKEYSKILLSACDYIQTHLFDMKQPVYSDYTYTRTRFLLFNYADHIKDIDGSVLSDVNHFKQWAKEFIKQGGTLWHWALVETGEKQQSK